ncbi:hypothetical protein D9M72_649610 [compost metagenome]
MPKQENVYQHETGQSEDSDVRVPIDLSAQHDKQCADRQAPGDRQDHQPIGRSDRLENECGGKICVGRS